jgi:type VI secretion system protein ImpL
MKMILELIKNKWFPRMKSALNSSVHRCKSEFHSLFLKIKYKSKGMKPWFSRRHQRHQLKKQPLFYLMGDTQSGKSTLIKKCGQRIYSSNETNHEMIEIKKQYKSCDWIFTDKMIAIKNLQQNEKNASKARKKILKYLKRRKRSKPLNGILLTVPINDLLLLNHEERQTKISVFNNEIRDLQHHVNAHIPIYLILTKMDVIEGFTEFYQDLSKEELTQIWGITTTYQTQPETNATLEEIHREYENLLTRLEQKVIYTLDGEKSIRSRAKIQSFPQQMRLFKKALITFISELNHSTHEHPLLLRGAYFTSATQAGQQYDFLFSSLAHQFNLTKENNSGIKNNDETYFIEQIFNQVIIPETKYLGENRRIKKIKKLSKRISIYASPLLAVFMGIGLTHAYEKSKKLIQGVGVQINDYQHQEYAIAADDKSLLSTLPALNTLKRINNSSESMSFADDLFIARHQMNSAASSALNRSIHSLFIPRIAANIESQLSQRQNEDPKSLYVLLKGYLAFSEKGKAHAQSIIAPIDSELNQSHDLNKQEINSINYYLLLASKQKLDALPLSRPLIDSTKEILQTINPAERAYALIIAQAQSSQIPPIEVTSLFEKNTNVFNITAVKDEKIENLYTLNTLNHNFDDKSLNISKSVANDNKEIGLNTGATETSHEIEQQVNNMYDSNYIDSWFKPLSSIKIQSKQTLGDVLQQLNEISQNNSAFDDILHEASQNTTVSIKNHQAINEKFEAINDYTSGKNTVSSLKKTKECLLNLYSALLKIKTQKNINQGFYNMSVDVMKKDSKNPLIQLADLANGAPYPVNNWLNQIKNNAWYVINQHSLTYIQQQLNLSVGNEYKQRIKGRFPFIKTSSNQVNAEDFNAFFNPNGKINNFFNSFLAPFINTNSVPWTAYHRDGLSLDLSQKNIDFFEKSNQITQSFFGNGKPEINFTLTPNTLNANASKIDIVLDDKRLHYAHGPQYPVDFTWPPKNSTSNNEIVLTDFNSNTFSSQFYGEWGLFKILNSEDCHIVKDGDSYKLSITSNSLNASFKLNTTATLNTIKLNVFRQLKYPSLTQETPHASS